MERKKVIFFSISSFLFFPFDLPSSFAEKRKHPICNSGFSLSDKASTDCGREREASRLSPLHGDRVPGRKRKKNSKLQKLQKNSQLRFEERKKKRNFEKKRFMAPSSRPLLAALATALLFLLAACSLAQTVLAANTLMAVDLGGEFMKVRERV